MRTLALVMLALAGCGDDGGAGGTHSDGGTTDEQTIEADAAIDAPPPNTTHVGQIQAARVGTNTTPPSVGFYDVPSSAAGCTWTYAGGCSLQTCDPAAGLVAVSAGAVTLTVGTTPTTITPDSENDYPNSTAAPLASGTSVSASAAGAMVPAFTTGTLVVPDPITVTEPATDATIMRTQPLTVAWTPAPGRVYVNISQLTNNGPYPALYLHTIRCDAAATGGTVVIPAELLAGLETGMNANVAVAASATELQDVGDYAVTFRIIVLDMVRQLPVQ